MFCCSTKNRNNYKDYIIIDGAIGTADAVITANVNGGTNNTNNLTIAHNGSAAADVDTFTPSDNNYVTAGHYIKLTSNGASTGTSSFTIEITY